MQKLSKFALQNQSAKRDHSAIRINSLKLAATHELFWLFIPNKEFSIYRFQSIETTLPLLLLFPNTFPSLQGFTTTQVSLKKHQATFHLWKGH